MQPYVTPLALISLGLVLALAYLGCLWAKLAKQVAPPGWRALRPGFGHWFSALGSAAFSTLLAWIYIFIGSARRDAMFQMKVASLLATAFGLCAVYSAWRIRAIKRENIRWRGSRIVRTDRDGQDRIHDGTSAVAWSRTWSGYFTLRLAEGSILYIDPFTKGSDEFIGDFGPPEDAEDIGNPRS
jgi:hypothetical protein